MSMEYYRGLLIQATRIEPFRHAITNSVLPDVHGSGRYSFTNAQTTKLVIGSGERSVTDSHVAPS